MTSGVHKAAFLDRDGVLVADDGPLTRAQDIRVLPGVPAALRLLADAGYRLIVVSNQTVVARQLLDEARVCTLQSEVEREIVALGGPPLDGFYFCPHHPNANDAAYRRACDCRKPRPGLVFQACREHGVGPSNSVFVGDRLSDVVAGQQAGCRTIWVHTGRHLEAPIEGAERHSDVRPTHQCADLLAGARWLVGVTE